MEEWHYNPTADLDHAASERPRVQRSHVVVRGIRALAAVVLRCWLRLYHRLTIVGRENLPLDRSFILVANHASHLDTPCLLAALPIGRLHTTFPVAAKDYFCKGTLRSLLAAIFVNALPFERRAAWQSLGTCAYLLEKPDNILILFPEGTRAGGSEPAEFKPGIALLTAGYDIPVVPCHLAGTHGALPKGAWCPRPRTIRLNIGPPRIYTHVAATKEAVKQICRELRQEVISLGYAEPEAKATGRVAKKEVLVQASP